MKKSISLFLLGIAAMTLSGCGGSGSSDGMFGNIPQTIEKYQEESKALKSGINASNYQKKQEEADKLKAETLAKLEKEGEALNGKELKASVNENELKIETPLTFVFKNVFSNVAAVEFTLDGNIVAANDIPLEVRASDLTYDIDFFGKEKGMMVVKVPVHLEFLDKENNVLDTRTIGFMIADNNGENAVLKQGASMDHQGGSLPINGKLVDATSARIVLDLSNVLTSYPQN